MKKNLFLMMMGIGLINLAVAQTVELVGVGVLNNDVTTLTFNDPGSIEKVVVEAAAIYDGVTPGTVKFYDSNETIEAATFKKVEQNLSSTVNGARYYMGYFTATFNDVDAGGITLDKTTEGESVKSFTAYVYRKGGNPDMYSEVVFEHAFLYGWGSESPLVYKFNIPAAIEPRDVEVSVPFTDLESNSIRWVVVTISADNGGYTKTSEFQTNNMGDLLRIESLELEVPGNVTDVMVEIYSPKLSIDGKTGDSFITGAVVLTTTDEDDWGCTYTQGYWKTHSEHGPAPYDDNWLNLSNIGADTEFYLSEMTWYEVFWTPVKGNAYYNLAHQYMAAHLNMLMGTSVPTEVADALADAEGIFAAKEPGYYAKTKGKSEASKQEIAELISLASILASYNEGDIGPGHCDDMEAWGMEKSAQIETTNNDIVQSSELTVYPNPVTGYATVSFMPVYDGKTTVDLYNSTGKTVKRLFSESVTKDIPVNFTFTASEFSEGLYFLVVQNGQGRETTKIDIK